MSSSSNLLFESVVDGPEDSERLPQSALLLALAVDGSAVACSHGFRSLLLALAEEDALSIFSKSCTAPGHGRPDPSLSSFNKHLNDALLAFYA